MNFMLDIRIPPPANQIRYGDKIMLWGSCFTEHIGGRLAKSKFAILQNPNGILFDPLSVSRSITACIENKTCTAEDLIYLNELWQSWDHHSVFSGTSSAEVVNQINSSTAAAHVFLRKTSHLVITLGSAFTYKLAGSSRQVANCHRAPGQTFDKILLDTHDIVFAYSKLLVALHHFNPALQVIFTISPVRHIRDGVIENNRSKSRLIEAVHSIVSAHTNCCYFPAYELVIDVLRDYRFYDIDMVHPNYTATEFVFEQFVQHYVHADERKLLNEVKNIRNAFSHRAMHPETQAHKQFLRNSLEKTLTLQERIPAIDFTEELEHFRASLK
jgi:hypothetical protein